MKANNGEPDEFEKAFIFRVKKDRCGMVKAVRQFMANRCRYITKKEDKMKENVHIESPSPSNEK